MWNEKNKDREKNVGPPAVIWECPLCQHVEHTVDPRTVRMLCPGCFGFSWMEHNGEINGREENDI